MTVCNSSPKGSGVLFWSLWVLHAHGAKTIHYVKHIKINNNKKLKKKNRHLYWLYHRHEFWDKIYQAPTGLIMEQPMFCLLSENLCNLYLLDQLSTKVRWIKKAAGAWRWDCSTAKSTACSSGEPRFDSQQAGHLRNIFNSRHRRSDVFW